MRKKNIFITKYDYERLKDLLGIIKNDRSKDQYLIAELNAEIERSKIVSSEDVSEEVVTMNSRVLVEDLNTQEEFPLEVVFPYDADLDAGKVSVLAPVGMALLGYKIGDTVAWKVPSGLRKLKIKKMLYQPKVGGDLSQQC